MNSKIKTIDFKSSDAPQEFVSSLINTGFAVIRNHSIDYQLIDKVYDIWGNFFKSDYKND